MPALERAGLELQVDVPDHLAARADPDHLAQVLANLLSNAARYTPRGGRVTVRAERRPADVLVSVANTGDRIPADDLPRVFERFYRVEKSRDRARGGAGIGLAIVKQLVEACGGRVGAESADGATRFWFSLPALSVRSATPARRRRARAPRAPAIASVAAAREGQGPRRRSPVLARTTS